MHAADHESGPPVESARFGLWLFLGSEALLFAGLIGSYLFLRTGSRAFPSPGEALDRLFVGCNTLLLVASSITASRSVKSGAQGARARWLAATLLLGGVFLALQLREYGGLWAQGILPRTNLYWSCFLVLTGVLMFRTSVLSMKDRARVLDEGKWTVLVATLCVAAVVISALSHELHAAKQKSLLDLALASSTMVLAWLFVAVVFAEHYAHGYYLRSGQLQFPGTPEPDYWDFTYFALVISMCCQTSDVAVTSSALRRLVLLHSVVSFFFNVIILASTVNVVASVL